MVQSVDVLSHLLYVELRLCVLELSNGLVSEFKLSSVVVHHLSHSVPEFVILILRTLQVSSKLADLRLKLGSVWTNSSASGSVSRSGPVPLVGVL